eukprot:CAMPEP_0206032794 /NCGR_PEP_ID=MMETSP1466-20131121/200_1 /ASSEMBLY_ACC=CAM_ASM_001126 /TAXON_ID=44452 /ORGANISM="Pavlova gyrans, Strain CCMP608" /LENGTH=286 /DNA_ID=CAMNT_0053406941 /DNA_START=84 /DNA_END=941 /DNA_ORIENTATION=-
MPWSPRAEIEAMRGLAHAQVRVESADLLQVVFADWLRVCLHVERDDYPKQRPLCFVEPEASNPSGDGVEAAIAKADALEWDTQACMPLHTFVQALVSALCDMRGVPAPTLPPVAASAAPDDLHEQNPSGAGADAGGSEEEDDEDGDDESDDFADGGEDEDFMFEEAPPSPSAPHTRPAPADGAPAAESSHALKKLKLSGKVDEYTLYQKFGRAKPPPAPAAGGASGASAATSLASTAHATDRLMKELKSIMGLDTDQEGFTAQPVGDNLYEWEVVLHGIHTKASTP